jgi:hypothetical protein
VRETPKRRPADATCGRPQGRVDGSNTTYPPLYTTRNSFSAPFVLPLNRPRPTDKQLLYTAEEKILYCIDALDAQESQLIEQAIAEHAGEPKKKGNETSDEEVIKRKLLLLKLHQTKKSSPAQPFDENPIGKPETNERIDPSIVEPDSPVAVRSPKQEARPSSTAPSFLTIMAQPFIEQLYLVRQTQVRAVHDQGDDSE